MRECSLATILISSLRIASDLEMRRSQKPSRAVQTTHAVLYTLEVVAGTRENLKSSQINSSGKYNVMFHQMSR